MFRIVSLLFSKSPSTVGFFSHASPRLFSGSSLLLANVTGYAPAFPESVVTGAIEKWAKNVGDSVSAGEEVVSIETDKTVMPVLSPSAGVIQEILVQAGGQITEKQALFILGPPSASASAPAATPAAAPAATPAAAAPKAPAPAAPAAAPVAAQKPASSGASGASSPILASALVSAGQRQERRVRMSPMRMKVAKRLKESQNVNAMLTTFNEIDMTNLLALRNRHKDAFAEKHGVKLGLMSPFVRAAALSLQDQPMVNAVIDGDDVVYRDFVDISVAVATPKGLVVPVLRNCEALSFAGVEKELAALSKKARDNQIALEDMLGGTFTISNGGVFGSLFGTPIINPPQSAILGMHATNTLPRVVDGEIVARPVMYVALTYDHRLIDGREAVTFLKNIKSLIEDPALMLLQ